MELVIDIVNYVLTAILIGISFAWALLLKSMWNTFRLTPYLDKFENQNTERPKISVILPARNEEEFIESCLDSLIEQDYENYEIIAINDSSTDRTGEIIKKYSQKNSKIVAVSAREKPEGWMGKNWACMEGYEKATGDLLLFTDSDTRHSKNLITLAVSHLRTFDLDALTVMPKMRAIDFWTKITLPMISTFLHTRFSPLRVNDPKKKTGYFFGSFFVIKKSVYQKVGMHEGVKQEIIEDGALGKKVKECGFRMKMVRGDHLLDAIWARDKTTLWNALKRLMVPLYLQSGMWALGIFFAVLFLLFMPFPLLAYASFFATKTVSFASLFISSLISCMLVYAGAVIEAKKGLHLRVIHAALGPIGSLVVVLGFLSGILQAKSSSAVSWRGRSYSMKDYAQNPINI